MSTLIVIECTYVYMWIADKDVGPAWSNIELVLNNMGLRLSKTYSHYHTQTLTPDGWVFFSYQAILYDTIHVLQFSSDTNQLRTQSHETSPHFKCQSQVDYHTVSCPTWPQIGNSHDPHHSCAFIVPSCGRKAKEVSVALSHFVGEQIHEDSSHI